MGLFDVNMPLLYGEGRKAFYRLQLEILNKSDDDSIFAWSADIYTSGMLAPWPSNFKDAGNISIYEGPSPNLIQPYRMNNRGLEFHLPSQLYSVMKLRSENLGFVEGWHVEFDLDCWKELDVYVRVRLWKINDFWHRVAYDDSNSLLGSSEDLEDHERAELERIYIR